MKLVQEKKAFLCGLLLTGIFIFPAVAQIHKTKSSETFPVIRNNYPDNYAFTLNGKLAGLPYMPQKVYLVYDSINARPADSALVKNGNYTFKGTINGPSVAYISPKLFDNKTRDALILPSTEYVATIYLDKGELTAVSDKTIRNITVTGSASNIDLKNALRQENKASKDTLQGVANLYKATKSKAYYDMFMLNIPLLEKTERQGHWAFMKEHPASPVNAYLICKDLAGSRNPVGYVDSLALAYKRLPAEIRVSAAGRSAADALERELKSALGHMAPEFTQNDINDKPISLSSFKGKYVMIAFWNAKDTGFDMGYLPYMQAAFSNYKDKGLAIITVSLDEDKDALRKVLETKNMPWINLMNSKGSANDLVKLFGSGLKNIVIAPNGRIMAKNLFATEISDTLNSIFN